MTQVIALSNINFDQLAEEVIANSDIYHESTAENLGKYGLPALRKAAMMGLTLQNDAEKIQRILRNAMIRGIRGQYLDPQPAA